ncbi:hypothetical protein K440DRAFT_622506 [Wilcoxina mikolae CBS 423.85]|nr:hypothetical protein K440DRAFT_622506 [Wilcoxina mikolae CBS 423.85]
MSSIRFYRDPNETIVHQSETELYTYWKDTEMSETLYKIVDFHFLGFEWFPLHTWTNITTLKQHFEKSYLSSDELTIVSGLDVEKEWSFRESFGPVELNIDIDGGGDTEKTTLEANTVSRSQSPLILKAMIAVPPNETVYLYQKRYHFRVQVWLYMDAHMQGRPIRKRDAEGPFSKEARVHIDGDQHIVMSQKRVGTANVKNVEKFKNPDTEMFYDIEWADADRINYSMKTQDYLHQRGA